MQAPRESAPHEPKADESNAGVEFIESCYWHVADVFSSFVCLSFSRAPIRTQQFHARTLPYRFDSEVAPEACITSWINRSSVSPPTFKDGWASKPVIPRAKT